MHATAGLGRLVAVDELREVDVLANVDEVPVVDARAPHAVLVDLESQSAYEVEAASRVAAPSRGDIAGIRRDFRLHEHEVERPRIWPREVAAMAGAEFAPNGAKDTLRRCVTSSSSCWSRSLVPAAAPPRRTSRRGAGRRGLVGRGSGASSSGRVRRVRRVRRFGRPLGSASSSGGSPRPASSRRRCRRGHGPPAGSKCNVNAKDACLLTDTAKGRGVQPDRRLHPRRPRRGSSSIPSVVATT